MKNYFHETFGSLLLFIRSKSFKIRSAIVIFGSLLLFGAFPYFNGQGPGLTFQDHGTIAPYANLAFPDEANIDLSISHRIAYPNLTFNSPIVFKTVPNQNRIILAQLDGEIYWFDDDETTLTKNLLVDLKNDVGIVHDGGFLGLALHPDFNATVNAKNYIYVYYTSKNSAGQNSPAVGSHTGQGCTWSEDRNEYQGNSLILERFEVNPIDLSFITGSRTNLFDIRMYGTTHYGGGMDFGDDGFLYLTIGDQASWRRAQNMTDNLNGGALRLDVDKDPTKSHAPIRKKQDVGYAGESSGINYWIPNDNPFLSSDGSHYEEYYSIGLRNPFRMTKDRVTGEFYIGDVGLSSHEEVNVLKKGANYGWPIYEGFGFRNTNCATMLDGMQHEKPLTEFSRNDARALAGGFVYRGSAIPDIYGKYICADYTRNGIFTVNTTSGDYDQVSILQNVISFGEDNDGELYLLRHGNNRNIHKLIEGIDNGYVPMPQLLSDTGVFSNLSTLEVIDGIVPYDLYESFWSDGALKRRWIAVPNNDGVHSGPDEQIKYSEYSDWEFPPGTIIIKQFDLQVDDNNPSITKKIETRFSIVDKDGGWYFLTYNWNDAQTDAVLQKTSLNEPVTISTDNLGGTRTQIWHFPSNTECRACHNDVNKGNLGLKARYLNTDFTYDETGLERNQLVTLSHLGIIDQSITDTDTESIITNKSIDDPEASLETRARSYLDLNCAYCHRVDNTIRTTFDLRFYNSLEATGILSTGILSPLGVDPDEKIIYPGDASKSILYHKINSVDPSIMMPPLAKLELDNLGVDLIEAWINQLDTDITDITNNPNPMSNLALLPSAVVSGSVGPNADAGRGAPNEILYDPMIKAYKTYSQYAEYGWPYQFNAGTVDEANGFFLNVEWPNPKFVNYITIGGSYSSQPQTNTMWRVSYLREGNWITLDQGKGGWIKSGIYEWGGSNQTPIYAEAVKVVLYSDGINDLYSSHLRGRGGNSGVGDNNPTNPYYNDVNTQTKASLFQFIPYQTKTTIESVVAGLQQTTCDVSNNTYSQDLIVTYTNPPTTGFLEVNGQNFLITTSPQTITLTGLIADGEDIEIIADFTDGYKSVYSSGGTVFTAPENCVDLIIGVDETVIIDADYTVSAAGKIDISEGGSLTITGNLIINGDVILNSISNKFSSLIVEGTSTGNITYKRHVNANNSITGNDLIATPVNGQTFGNFAIDNNPNLFENPTNTAQKLFGPFDETSGTYSLFSTDTNATTNLELGIGYRAARESLEDALYGTTLSFYGGVETNAVTRNITTSGSSFDGWNLIGNPYTSYVDFDAFFNHNKSQLNGGTHQAIYGYDGDASNGWTVLNNLTTQQLIAPGQGFFVKSKSGGGSVEFTPDMRASGSSDDFILGRGVSSTHVGYLKLKSSATDSEYYTDIYFNNNATSGLDPGYDAALYNSNIPAFSIYTHLVEDNIGIPFMIQALGETAINNVTVALGLHANQGQEVTISIFETDISEATNIYLEDTSNNTFTLLNTSNYIFTANSDVSGTGRFSLRFETDVLNINKPMFEALKISTNQSQRTIEVTGQLEEQTSFVLYDIHGRIILTKELDIRSTYQSIDVSHLSTGIYIVELETISGGKRIQKLIIR